MLIFLKSTDRTVSLILDLSDVSCWFDTDYGFLADRAQKWCCNPQGAPYQEAYNIDLSHCRWCTHCSLHSGAVSLLYFLFELINNLRGYTLRICKYLVIIFLLIKCNIHWWICLKQVLLWHFLNSDFSNSIMLSTFIIWNYTLRKSFPISAYLFINIYQYWVMESCFIL